MERSRWNKDIEVIFQKFLKIQKLEYLIISDYTVT